METLTARRVLGETATVVQPSSAGLLRKLGVVDGTRVALVAAPADFRAQLEPLPPAARIVDGARGNNDVVVFFATRTNELRRRFPKLANAVRADGGLWIVWPRRSACIATDLSERLVREIGVEQGLLDVKVSQVNDDWKGIRFELVAPKPAEAARSRS